MTKTACPGSGRKPSKRVKIGGFSPATTRYHGLCSVCGKELNLTQSGTVRKHVR